MLSSRPTNTCSPVTRPITCSAQTKARSHHAPTNHGSAQPSHAKPVSHTNHMLASQAQTNPGSPVSPDQSRRIQQTRTITGSAGRRPSTGSARQPRPPQAQPNPSHAQTGNQTNHRRSPTTKHRRAQAAAQTTHRLSPSGPDHHMLSQGQPAAQTNHGSARHPDQAQAQPEENITGSRYPSTCAAQHTITRLQPVAHTSTCSASHAQTFQAHHSQTNHRAHHQAQPIIMQPGSHTKHMPQARQPIPSSRSTQTITYAARHPNQAHAQPGPQTNPCAPGPPDPAHAQPDTITCSARQPIPITCSASQPRQITSQPYQAHRTITKTTTLSQAAPDHQLLTQTSTGSAPTKHMLSQASPNHHRRASQPLPITSQPVSPYQFQRHSTNTASAPSHAQPSAPTKHSASQADATTNHTMLSQQALPTHRQPGTLPITGSAPSACLDPSQAQPGPRPSTSQEQPAPRPAQAHRRPSPGGLRPGRPYKHRPAASAQTSTGAASQAHTTHRRHPYHHMLRPVSHTITTGSARHPDKHISAQSNSHRRTRQPRHQGSAVISPYNHTKAQPSTPYQAQLSKVSPYQSQASQAAHTTPCSPYQAQAQPGAQTIHLHAEPSQAQPGAHTNPQFAARQAQPSTWSQARPSSAQTKHRLTSQPIYQAQGAASHPDKHNRRSPGQPHTNHIIAHAARPSTAQPVRPYQAHAPKSAHTNTGGNKAAQTNHSTQVSPDQHKLSHQPIQSPAQPVSQTKHIAAQVTLPSTSQPAPITNPCSPGSPYSTAQPVKP
eukprot:gene10727-17862_t